MANESLGKAKSRKNDEFYTVYDYIPERNECLFGI